MIKVGITGNTGSELDYICSTIEKYYDIPVFDADLAIKFKLLYDEKTIQMIKTKYGSQIYEKGLLNLEFFKNDTLFEELIGLVYSDIYKRFLKWRYQNHNDKKIVMMKSMILVESEWTKSMDYNISVYKPKSMRVNETRQMKFLPSSLVNKIFNSEMSDELKNSKCDYTIQNYEPYTNSVKSVNEQISSIISHLTKKTDLIPF